MRARTLIISAALLCAAMVEGAAQPVIEGAAQPIVVFESHVGGRPDQAADRLDHLLGELEQLGYSALPATIEKAAGGRLPRPGVLDRQLSVDDILREVELGYADVTKARWPSAEQKLEKAVKEIERNPALFVHDMALLATIEKAYVGLTVSQFRENHRDRASVTMNKLVRLTRSQPISQFDHGRNAEKFANDIHEQVSRIGRGKIAIKTDNPNATIFIDRELRGVHNAKAVDLIPGSYSVLIKVQQDTLQFALEVEAARESVLDVRWSQDSKLVVTQSWIGLSHATESQRKDEGIEAISYVRRWSRGSQAVVVGTKRVNGKLAVFGTVYREDGKPVREGAVMLDEASDHQLRLLARFIFDGKPNVGISVSGAVTESRPSTIAAGSRRGLLLGGLGIAAVTTGIALVSTAVSDPEGQQQERITSRPGQVLQVGGHVALAVGAYLWIRDTKPSARRAIPAVATMYGLATIGWGVVWFVTDDDQADSPGPNFNDTAKHGALLVGAGAAVAITGGILWWTSTRGPTKSAVVPRLSISRDHAFAGFTASF